MNLLSAALTLFQGAVAGGFARADRIPESMIDVAGFAALFSDDSPSFPGRAPHLESTHVPAARVPKGVEEPGGLAEAEQPVQITLRGVKHTMPDWHMEEISYTKRTDAELDALRAAFPPVRKAFLKDLAENDTAALRDAGMSDDDIAGMAVGRVPGGYEVHHVLPVDDGGTNATDNLMLIKTDPDHRLITNYQNEQTRGMSAGQTRMLEWPMPDSRVRVWPKTADGGAYPTVHKLEWPMPGSRVRVWPKMPDGCAYRTGSKVGNKAMSDINDLLAAIYGELREFKQMIRPPASPEAIERLRQYARDTLRVNLPEGYVTFLGRNDGLVFNGYTIYGATEHTRPFLSGFLETNEILGWPEHRYVFYGQTGDELYAQDRTSMAWAALDRPSLRVLETFPSFAAMLAQVLREATAFIDR